VLAFNNREEPAQIDVAPKDVIEDVQLACSENLTKKAS
jgi:hypothetical protein